VIREPNPTYYNLVGKVEYESRQGYLYTDFRRIMPGAIHKANGGFLVLEAEELLRQFMSWDALKRVLRTEELTIENLGEQLGFVPVSSLSPEAIPIRVKVVVVGTRWLYYLLNIYDPEFSKIFKIKADFDEDMPRNAETEKLLACFVASFVQKEGGLPYSAEGVAEVIEWASRLADHQERMSTQFNKLAEILVESTAWARMERATEVDRSHVRRAIEEKNFRSPGGGTDPPGLRGGYDPGRRGGGTGGADQRPDRARPDRPHLRTPRPDHGQRVHGAGGDRPD
jgi:predicted ATP-dependent protease